MGVKVTDAGDLGSVVDHLAVDVQDQLGAFGRRADVALTVLTPDQQQFLHLLARRTWAYSASNARATEPYVVIVHPAVAETCAMPAPIIVKNQTFSATIFPVSLPEVTSATTNITMVPATRPTICS